MHKRRLWGFSVLLPWTLALVACSPSGTSATGDLGSGSDGGSGACTLSGQTTATAKVTNGCAVLTRDSSACMASRTAQGLGGAWLKFSCRVTLTVMGSASPAFVQVVADSQPDYTSNYFATTNACYSAYTTQDKNPNVIAAQSLNLKIRQTANDTNTLMGLGPVGVAVNGVAIYDNQAGPGDDIFKEAATFDRCGGHPDMKSSYHYHSEPYAISSDDANLIGVLRDGHFVYGRRDADGTMPTLDGNGGHVGTTADSQTPVYHYHLNQQTSTTAGTAGQMQYFLTKGTYQGNTA